MDPLPPIVPTGPQVAATVRAAQVNPDAHGSGQGRDARRPRRRPGPHPVGPPAGELADEFADDAGDLDDGGDGRPHVDVTA